LDGSTIQESSGDKLASQREEVIQEKLEEVITDEKPESSR